MPDDQNAVPDDQPPATSETSDAPRDDPALVARVQAGDVEALADYLAAVEPQLMAFVHRRLGTALKTRVEAGDIYQEASIEAIKTISPQWPGDRNPFSWLCQIAERKIVDAHRHHFAAQKRDAGRQQSLDRPVGGDEGGGGLVNLLVKSMTTPSAAFSRNAKEARLQTALLTLKDDQREAIRLKYLEGWPSKQIAERLGKSDAAVRVMLTRTMKTLQAMLDQSEPPPPG